MFTAEAPRRGGSPGDSGAGVGTGCLVFPEFERRGGGGNLRLLEAGAKAAAGGLFTAEAPRRGGTPGDSGAGVGSGCLVSPGFERRGGGGNRRLLAAGPKAAAGGFFTAEAPRRGGTPGDSGAGVGTGCLVFPGFERRGGGGNLRLLEAGAKAAAGGFFTAEAPRRGGTPGDSGAGVGSGCLVFPEFER